MSAFIALILSLAAAVAALVNPAPQPEPAPTTTVVTSAPLTLEYPTCEPDASGGVWAYASEDPGQLTGLDCDVVPPMTLNVIFDEVSWGDHETWGSDASLAWADRECLDWGGTPEWQPTVYLVCRAIDY